MAENKERKRIQELKRSPRYRIGEPAPVVHHFGETEPGRFIHPERQTEIDWRSFPSRPEIANRMLWLGYSEHDRPLRAAFKFFGLDETNPFHWRIMIEYFAESHFANKRNGARLKTLSENEILLKRSLECRPKPKTDADIIRFLQIKYRKDYESRNVKALQKKLKVAREEQARKDAF